MAHGVDLNKFKSKITVQIRYADLDTYGHVNNKVYLGFLEDARIQYIRDLGLAEKFTVFDFGAVVGRIDIKYLYPIQLGDKVGVYTRCVRIGNKSYDLESVVIIETYGQTILAARALVTMVSFDLKTGKSRHVNPDFVRAVLDFEAEPPQMRSQGSS